MHKTRNLGSTVYFWFAANDTSGSGADGETPQCDVRLAGAAADAAPVLSPTPTLLTHANYGAGLHEVAIAATAANGFAAGNEYAVFCTLLVDSQNPAGFLGSFYLTAADQAPLTVDDIQNGLPRDDQWTDARAALIDQLDAATDDTVANILADITEEADGTYRITAAALALLHDLSAQEVRDALKLAPTVGDPAEGSVDAMLDAIGDSAFDPASDEVNIGSVKGVAVSGVSDFRATGFAVAGDAMTLTPSERGSVAAAVWAVLTSALTTEGSIGKLIVDYLDVAVSTRSSHTAEEAQADVSALALEATLDEIKGAGWTNETLAAIHALVEALNDLSSADAQAAAAAALAAYDAATGTDVTNATSGLSTFDAGIHEVNVGEVKGVAVTGVDDFKATGFSTHTAADAATAVWAAGTRTLTGFGTLVADIVAGVWGAAQRTLTAFGFITEANVTQVGGAAVASADDLKADVSSLATSADINALNDLSSADAQAAAAAALTAYDPPTKAELDAAELAIRGADNDTLKTLSDEIAGVSAGDATQAKQDSIIASLNAAKGAGFDAATDSLEALRDRGDSGAWSGAAGSGSNKVEVTASDGAGLLANGVKVTVEDADGNTVGILTTNSLGVVIFYLDDGTYTFVTATTSFWQGSSTEVEVSGDTAVAITLVAQVLPLPSAPDKYIIIVNAADEFGDLAGAGSWRIRITDVWPRGLPGVDLVQLTRQTPITLDANGQAAFEIAKETTAFALSITPQLAAGADGATEIIRVTVDPTVANEYDQIYLADLLTY